MDAKRINAGELPDFDVVNYLDDSELMAEYLTAVFQANDAGLLASALGDIALAKGISEIAQASGVTREVLYEAMRAGSSPSLDTVKRVCGALGVRLTFETVAAKPAKKPRAAGPKAHAKRAHRR